MPQDTSENQKQYEHLVSLMGMKPVTTLESKEPLPKEENKKESIYWALAHALEHCEELQKTERSRELSLVITKIEEAQMWYERIYQPK